MTLLAEEVVIITGATKGIGRAIALRLAKLGASVVVNARTEEDVEMVVNEINSFGGTAIGVAGRVEDMYTGKKIVEAAHRSFGKMTILINNAGTVRDRVIYKMAEEDWDDVIASHLKGAFSLTSQVVHYLVEQKIKGTIINMTSTSGLEGTIGQSNYSTAKAGLLGLTWTLAKELKRKEISVYAVAPAALTEMTRPHVELAEKLAQEKGESISDYWKIGSPDDVANFFVKLLQKREKLATGHVFSVNGNKIGKWYPPVYEEITNFWE
jgi:3-oxoacyl-[acyl-carrier protein] reductase